MPGITILFLVGISWVVIPAILIGWLAGYADGQLIAAVLWGLIVIFIYSRSRVRLDGKIDRATLILALIQGAMGGLIVYYVGLATH
jgi:hypothetical protein